MTAKELFELCTNVTADCTDCPYKDKQAECKVVHDAIHMLRHPSWYVKGYSATPKTELTFAPNYWDLMREPKETLCGNTIEKTVNP